MTLLGGKRSYPDPAVRPILGDDRRAKRKPGGTSAGSCTTLVSIGREHSARDLGRHRGNDTKQLRDEGAGPRHMLRDQTRTDACLRAP